MVKNRNVQRTDLRDMRSGRMSLQSPAKRNNTASCHRRTIFSLNITELLHKSTQRLFHKDNSLKSTHFGHCGTKTTSIKKLFFVSILISIVAQERLCTLAAVARAPGYISLSDAFEESKCDVREEIISVRQEHPTLPTNAKYSPSCVKLNRCSGCCMHDSMRCVPTSEYTTIIQISEQILFPEFSYKKLELEFTHHESCECRSHDESRPVCVQKACNSQETWDAEECRCIATPDIICVERNCGQGQRWNGETCDCEAFCERRVCGSGQIWNDDACDCEASCRIQRCPIGQIIDLRTCSCTPKCPVGTCSPGEFWNRATCSCQCKPCRRGRIIHRRFGGNVRRCLCRPNCKYERGRRILCESRQRIFIPETCSCIGRTGHFGR